MSDLDKLVIDIYKIALYENGFDAHQEYYKVIELLDKIAPGKGIEKAIKKYYDEIH